MFASEARSGRVSSEAAALYQLVAGRARRKRGVEGGSRGLKGGQELVCLIDGGAKRNRRNRGSLKWWRLTYLQFEGFLWI